MHVVIDTNVIFEGLTKQTSVAGLVIDAWFVGLLEVFVSDTLAYEYVDVLSRKLSIARWQRSEIVLTTLLEQAEFVTVHYSWRPSAPDPGDEHVIDCAMNANAIVVTSNLRDFQLARKHLGVRVVSPTELLALLAAQS